MRDMREIMEKVAGGTVTLYRGDSTEIEKFEFGKTKDSALFGMGIYLTDSPEVARDYTAAKGEGGLLFRVENDNGGARTPQELVRAYLHVLAGNDGLSDKLRDLKSDWQDRWWREAPVEDADRRAAQDTFQQQFNAARSKLIRTSVEKAKKQFDAERPTMGITKLTTGEYVLTSKGRKGRVTSFEVPTSYVGRVLHTEQPMPDDVVQACKRVFMRKVEGSSIYDGDNTAFDLRTYAPARKGMTKNGGMHHDDEDRGQTFDQFIANYKKHGARYAWAGHKTGGDGRNPSLDVLWNGTHSGQIMFDGREAQAAFIKDLEALGYVGFAYDGGVRLAGTGARGGGGVRHNAYVFWNVDEINGFKASVEGVADDDVGALHKGMHATKIYEP